MSIRNYKDKKPEIGLRVYIDQTAVVIGDVRLGDDVSIWPTSVVRGDVETISIGSGTNIQDGAVLHVSHAGDFSPQGHPLNIGQGVTIGHRAVVHGCRIGHYCLIGIGAIILDDAVIEDFVMLGAGALVPPGKKLETGFLYVGAPVKQARSLTDAEKAFLEYSSRHYMALKDTYLQTR
ncbi:MAG: gamma carbonic anhydrase family protein [Methylococcales bacterium]|nr:gamma carbonic anhydrase family protein [Methylococcales bacterium]